jgi:hypothetical protein
MRMSGPIRTAIMSLPTCSPLRTPASVTLADDIRQPVVHRDLDLDVRIVAQKLSEFRQQDCVSRIFGCRDANVARGLVAKLAQRRKLGFDLLEPRAEGLHEPLARFRWRNPARGASEQPHAEPLLKLPHGVAQCGLRNAKLGRSPGEAPLPRYGKEGEEIVQMAALHSWLLLISACRV